MLISRNWLQSYFEIELPDAQTLADVLMVHSFEIEDVYQKGDDWIIDVDVLPNRAHDCLCHQGIAKEVAGLLNIDIKDDRYRDSGVVIDSDHNLVVDVRNNEMCPRYIGLRVDNISLQTSPEWLQSRLESIGQKSINNLVDMTNFTMFDCGQPMHVFDADKIVGGITVRNAFAGEHMTTLSGEDIELLETDLVIADDEGILALAGVKGGTKAEVDEHTKNIIIESANFNPITTRKTARRVKILTDASKRYENEITEIKAGRGMTTMLALISEYASNENTIFYKACDVYPNPKEQEIVSVGVSHIQGLLGLDINESEISDILNRFAYQYRLEDGVYTITIPFDRLDLRIAEDIIEEIGRIYGYYRIPSQNLDDYDFEPIVHGMTYLAHQLRNYLIDRGYTELMTYSFLNKGDVEVYNPIASDKKALRKNLTKLLEPALEKNIRNSDYFGVDVVRVFEIGKIYTKDGEHFMCTIAVHNPDKRAQKQYGSEQNQLESLHTELQNVLGCSFDVSFEGNMMSFNLDSLIPIITVPLDYQDSFEAISYHTDASFHTISPYQYVRRDISLWVHIDDTEESLIRLMRSLDTNYLQKVFLFDEFEKDGKKSLAFSLIFQSDERTLVDHDVDREIQTIIEALEKHGCSVR